MIDPASPDYLDTPDRRVGRGFSYAPRSAEGTPRVSIVTPFAALSADVFPETARCVLGQSFQQFEWIIVNDGTTDPASAAALAPYRRHDPRIRVIDHPQPIGPAGARNTGLETAKAEFVLLLDAGDLLEPTAAEKLLWYLRSHPEHSAVNAWMVRFGDEQALDTGGFDRGAENLESDRIPSLVMVRRDAIRRVGGFDVGLRDEDERWDLWLRLAEAGMWGGTIHEYLGWHRRRAAKPDGPNDRGADHAAFRQHLRHKHQKLFLDGLPEIPPRTWIPFEAAPAEIPEENLLARPKPRLLLIVPWMTMGGADKFNLDLTEQLNARGWEVSIAATLAGDNPWAPQFTRQTPDVFILDHFLAGPDYPAFLAGLIRSRRFDAVMVTGSQLGYLLTPYLRAMCPGPVYVDFCHIEEPPHGGYARFTVGLRDHLDLSLVTSQHLRGWMTTRGVEPERVEVVYINVDPQSWTPDPENRRRLREELGIGSEEVIVLYAARLCDQKQPLVLAEAVRLAVAKGLSFTTLVAGDGPDRGALERFVAENGLDSHIRLLGAQSSDRMRMLMAASDLFFLPSQWEGIALTIYEAMSSGLAVLACDVGGQRELVTPECGILLPPEPRGDRAARHATALERLIRDGNLRAQLGKRARERICASFTIDKMADAVIAAIHKARDLRTTRTRPPITLTTAVEMATQAMELTRLNSVCDHLWQEQHRLPEGAGGRLRELETAREYLLGVIHQRNDAVLTLQAALDRADEEKAALVRQARAERDALTMKHAELQRAFDERAADLAALQRTFDERNAVLAELHRWAETLDARLAEKVEQVHRLERQLAECSGAVAELRSIHESTGWAVLQRMYRVRFFLCPVGSRRDKLGRLCMRTLRWSRERIRRIRQPRAALPFAEAPVHDAALAAPGAADTEPSQSVPSDAHPCHASAIPPDIPGLVSVILPVYNQADLLRDSIESVLGQTYPDFELIINNDGSTDGVNAVLREYAGHPRVRILTQPNQKLPKALSNAFEFARGEFRTWTSADNLMAPTHLEREVGFLRRNPDVTMVYANYTAIDDRGQPLRDPSFRPHNRREPNSPVIYLPHDPGALNTVDDNYMGPCFMYRGWAGRMIGEYAPEFGLEDYDYWMRMNRLFRIAHLDSDEPLYLYRVHDNTISALAAELKISQRVARLMKYEQERGAYYDRPWIVYADAPTLSWLDGIDHGVHEVRPLSGLSPTIQNTSKTLLLISDEGLESLPAELGDGDVCVAVWFGRNAAAPYLHRATLQRRVDVCFSADAPTVARAGLFHPQAYGLGPGQTLFDRAIAFANNHCFYRRTVAPEVRARRLPEPFLAADAPCVLVQVEHFAQGGLEQVVIDLLCVLRARNFTPLLLVLGKAGPGVDKVRNLGITVLQLGETDREAAYARLLSEHQVRLINSHFCTFGAAAAAQAGIPYVQTIHSCYVSLGPDQIAAYRENDPLTSAYICTSALVAMYADLKLGLSPEKMIIIPNGIDPARLEVGDRQAARSRLRQELGLTADDFVFLHVGSIYRDKAQDLIAKALAEVVKSHPRAKAVFVGSSMDDAYLAELHREIARLGLQQAVIFAGHREQIAPFYALADAFLLPSFWEGWSLALAEAVYMGLPVIATAVGSAPDLLPQVGGRLIRPEFDSVLDLDANTLNRYLLGDHARLLADLAGAMKAVCADPKAPAISEEFRKSLESRQAYGMHARLFAWLLQGGSPCSACVWTRSPSDR